MENTATPINWFPGHMAKTKRILMEQIRRIDLVIELCDARLPYSSRNPEINTIAHGKKRIILLNKADLADPKATSQWIRFIQQGGFETYAIDSKKLKAKTLSKKSSMQQKISSIKRWKKESVKPSA